MSKLPTKRKAAEPIDPPQKIIKSSKKDRILKETNKSVRPNSSVVRTTKLIPEKPKKVDLDKRLHDLELQNVQTEDRLVQSTDLINSMTKELALSQERINELINFKFSVQVEKTASENTLRDFQDTIAQLKEEKQTSLLSTQKLQEEIAKMSIDFNALKLQLETCQHDLSLAKTEIVQYKVIFLIQTTISIQAASQVATQSENAALNLQIQQLTSSIDEKDLANSNLTSEKSSNLALIAELEARILQEEKIRRELHNTIQELKGNIRVFCRVRPCGHGEEPLKINYGEVDDRSIDLIQSVESASGKLISKTFSFNFDKVFQPESDQKVVFGEISQLVQSALDGYNVSIFAYGQTGSGKTFTMQGPNDLMDLNDPRQGMIPRAVFQIFETAGKLKQKGWEYKMTVQYLEIYNEALRDLLGSQDPAKKYEIKHEKGKTTVTDAVIEPVTTPEMVFELLVKAAQNRSVAATYCNEHSSRSHSVFTLTLTGHNPLTLESSEGNLNLIDLAGSERLSVSGATGDRLKETQAINKSLSSLGDVIFALANKDNHIPYRNSKVFHLMQLTYLLQNSLGGNSKTLMFVNVNPANFSETISSLRFATKVNSCQIGTARKK